MNFVVSVFLIRKDYVLFDLVISDNRDQGRSLCACVAPVEHQPVPIEMADIGDRQPWDGIRCVCSSCIEIIKQNESG